MRRGAQPEPVRLCERRKRIEISEKRQFSSQGALSLRAKKSGMFMKTSMRNCGEITSS
jgi:hypothetical protein